MVVSEMECKKFSDVLSIGDGYAHAFKIMVLSVLKQELFFSFQGRQLGKVNQHWILSFIPVWVLVMQIFSYGKRVFILWSIL